MQLFYKDDTTNRKTLIKWSLLFGIFNLIIMLIVALSYVSTMSSPENALSWAYLISVTFGHFSFLLLLAFIVFILPLLILIPKKKFVIPLFIILAALGITFLKIDTYVFAQYKFHINLFLIQMMIDAGDQVIGFPLQMWLILFSAITLLIILQIVTANFLWNNRERLYKKLRPQWIFSSFLALYFVSQFIHMYADAQYDRTVTSLTRYYPLMFPATARSFMAKQGWGSVKQAEASTLIREKSNLNYPLEPLTFQQPSPASPLNILMLVIDSWRFDMMSAAITPNIYSLAENSIQLKNHFSGSNDTRNGIFSLFYSLPATYWHSFESNQLGPVLMDRLIGLNYQTGIYASAPLTNPQFDRTVFKRVENLQTSTEGKTAYARDLKITDEWDQWLTHYHQHSASKPFFGFLFYDSVHAYQYPDNYPRHFLPTNSGMNYFSLNNETDKEPVVNLYKNITHFVDSLIGKIITGLKDKNLLKNTVIIITGDHSQELNDNNLNYWGHNGNYTRYQTQVPMVIYWPGKQPTTIEKMTTHYDIVPTLMNNILLSTSKTEGYSIGRDLFAENIPDIDSHIMGNVSNFAIYDLQKQLMLIKDYTGDGYTVDTTYREINNKKVRPEVIRNAIDDMSRFYK